MQLTLLAAPTGGLPYTLTLTLTRTLNATTQLYSPTALTYGAVTPAHNTPGKFYFNGRSDNFVAGGNSGNANNACLDPDALRVSADGRSVFVSDECGPYVYQFDRASGARLRSYALPAAFAASNVNALAATEIGGNSS